MFGSIGLQEVLIVALVVALLFGAKRIPEVFRGLGRGIHEFKKGMRGEGEEEEKTTSLE